MTRSDARTYDDLDTEAQVEVLRRVALEAAPAFGLEVADLALVLHGFNTTFRLDTVDGRTVALRVNTNSLAEPEHLRAQQAWVHAVATETDVCVPDAVRTTGGEVYTAVRAPDVRREFRVLVNTWLEGPDVERCDAVHARALGRVMATLHEQAKGWVRPGGAGLPVFDEPLLGDENRIEGHDLLGAGDRIVAEALVRTRRAFTGLEERIVVHGDLHGGNLKWHRGRLAVFDFDDSGLASPAFDLAVATFYLRDDPEIETALRAGYLDVAPLPEVPDEVFEALVASRQLLLANSLLTSSTAELRGMAPEYLDRTSTRLAHWLDSGHFVLDPLPA